LAFKLGLGLKLLLVGSISCRGLLVQDSQLLFNVENLEEITFFVAISLILQYNPHDD
jgi:hypothetical protein